MRCRYGLVEGDLGGCTRLDDYSTALVAEDAITSEVSVRNQTGVSSSGSLFTYWPAAAWPKLCSLDGSNVLLAMLQRGRKLGPLAYSSAWLCVQWMDGRMGELDGS